MYERGAKSAPSKSFSQQFRKAQRQAGEWYTTASQWTLAIVILYIVAPGITPAKLIATTLTTTTRAAQTVRTYHFTRPRLPAVHVTDGA